MKPFKRKKIWLNKIIIKSWVGKALLSVIAKVENTKGKTNRFDFIKNVKLLN